MMPRTYATSLPPVGRCHAEGPSPVGLAAAAALLHVAIAAGRVPVRAWQHRPVTRLAWRVPSDTRVETRRDADKVPSRPCQRFCAGQLELTTGMAVLVLAFRLHIMRINGAHGP